MNQQTSISSYARGYAAAKRYAAVVLAHLVLPLAALGGTPPYPADECPADRLGTNLKCTAKDVVFAGNPIVTRVDGNTSGPFSCIAGTQIEADLIVNVQPGSSNRYNLGLFIGNNGGNMLLQSTDGGNQTCSNYVFPLPGSPPSATDFDDLDGNVCGDVAGPTLRSTEIFNVELRCSPSGVNGLIDIPMLVSWSQGAGVCLDNTYPAPGTSSKCDASKTLTTAVAVEAKLTILKVAAGGGTTSFPYSATATSGGNAATPSPASFNLTNQATQVVTVPYGAGPAASIAVTEGTLPAGWFFQGISCVDDATGQPATYVSVDTANRRVTANFNRTNVAATCTFTNQQTSPQVLLSKTRTAGTWKPGSTGNEYTLTATLQSGTIAGGALVISDIIPQFVTVTGITTGAGISCSPPGNATVAASSTVTLATPLVGGQTLTCENSTGMNNANPSRSVVLTVSLAAGASGTISNSITGDVGGVPQGSAAETFSILAPPTLAKSFNPAAIEPGAVTTLTLSLGNANAADITLTAQLTDNLPNGLVVATPPNLDGTCPGTVTATAGSGSISYADGARIPAGGCTIRVDVTAPTAGSYVNTIASGALVTSAGSNDSAASSNSLVVGPLSAPSVSKDFSPTSIAPGGTSILTLTLGNSNLVPLTLTADLEDQLPSGMLLADPPAIGGTCSTADVLFAKGTAADGGYLAYGAGAEIPPGGCSITASVTVDTPGIYSNVLAVGALATTGGSSGAVTTANLEIPTPTPTDTPVPTATATSVPTDTPAPTATATSVPTDTPVPTATATPTATNTAAPAITCAPQPFTGCKQAGRRRTAGFVIDNFPPAKPKRDRLRWAWRRGDATVPADFGDPMATTSYAFCVYDGTGSRIVSASIEAGEGWRKRSRGRSYLFRDRFLEQYGVRRLLLRTNARRSDRAAFDILMRGKAGNLGNANTGNFPELPSFPLLVNPDGLIVQLANSNGVCWENRFSQYVRRNYSRRQIERLRARND